MSAPFPPCCIDCGDDLFYWAEEADPERPGVCPVCREVRDKVAHPALVEEEA